MAGKKIVRSANFKPMEEELLVQLVKQKKDGLECKTSDLHSTQSKNAAWKAVTDEFNAACPRSVSLRVCLCID